MYANKCHEKDNFLNILYIFSPHIYEVWCRRVLLLAIHGEAWLISWKVIRKKSCQTSMQTPEIQRPSCVFWQVCDENNNLTKKIVIHSFPEHFMLNVYVLHHKSYFWHYLRFFLSISLVQTLLHNGIFGCGTIKCVSEGFPPELRNPDLRRG